MMVLKLGLSPSRSASPSAVLSILLSTIVATTVGGQFFDRCNAVEYYGSLPVNTATWTRNQVHSLLETTHRGVVADVGSPRGEDDIWAALMELDEGSEFNQVDLIYSGDEKLARPFGGSHWRKEYLWPLNRGVGAEGMDFVDVHNIRPSSVLSRNTRSSKVFGDCATLNYGGGCMSPAAGGASSTCVCNSVYEPPDNRKGEVARAIMYMDIRYDGSEDNTTDLTLTDCPFQPQTDMGYKSQLLKWHNAFPPTARELQRNQLACLNWQGNRNPFVDHPELADMFYGPPLPDPADDSREIYPACDGLPTLSPTLTSNGCEEIEVGSVIFALVHSDEPDQVAFFVIDPLPGDLELFLTDNAWTGNDFEDNEGIIRYITPPSGVPIATYMGYGPNIPRGDEWETVEGTFNLSPAGEQVFLFCYGSTGQPVPLAAISYNGPFQDAGLARYRFNQSALPDRLNVEGGNIVLPHKNNWKYDGKSGQLVDDLKVDLLDIDNWKGDSAGTTYMWWSSPLSLCLMLSISALAW